MEPDEIDEPTEDDEDTFDEQHWIEWGPYDIQPFE